jgi:hypothetical protein
MWCSVFLVRIWFPALRAYRYTSTCADALCCVNNVHMIHVLPYMLRWSELDVYLVRSICGCTVYYYG